MKLELDVTPILEDKLRLDTVTLLDHLVSAWQVHTDEAAMVSALETALCLARGLEGNAGETVHASRRTNINWNATPERIFLKCVLGALVRKGLPKGELLAKFKTLIPSYQGFFDIPVSDSAVWGRADTARRGGKYRHENPDVHPVTRPYWPLAQMVVADDRPLTADDVRSVCRLICDEQESAKQGGEAKDKSTEDEPAANSENCVLAASEEVTDTIGNAPAAVAAE